MVDGLSCFDAWRRTSNARASRAQQPLLCCGIDAVPRRGVYPANGFRHYGTRVTAGAIVADLAMERSMWVEMGKVGRSIVDRRLKQVCGRDQRRAE